MKASKGLILSQWSCKLRGRRYRNIIGQQIMALNVSKKNVMWRKSHESKSFLQKWRIRDGLKDKPRKDLRFDCFK